MKKLMVALFLAILLGLAGFLGKDYLPFGFTTISAIKAAPQSFEGKLIKVYGKVVEITKIPFINAKSYRLKDGNAEITVSPAAELPAQGSNIAIIAKVDNIAIIGDETIGLQLKEIKVLPAFVRPLR